MRRGDRYRTDITDLDGRKNKLTLRSPRHSADLRIEVLSHRAGGLNPGLAPLPQSVSPHPRTALVFVSRHIFLEECHRQTNTNDIESEQHDSQ